MLALQVGTVLSILLHCSLAEDAGRRAPPSLRRGRRSADVGNEASEQDDSVAERQAFEQLMEGGGARQLTAVDRSWKCHAYTSQQVQEAGSGWDWCGNNNMQTHGDWKYARVDLSGVGCGCDCCRSYVGPDDPEPDWQCYAWNEASGENAEWCDSVGVHTDGFEYGLSMAVFPGCNCWCCRRTAQAQSSTTPTTTTAGVAGLDVNAWQLPQVPDPVPAALPLSHGNFPPVLMHYETWFSYSTRTGVGNWHWVMNEEKGTWMSHRIPATHTLPAAGVYHSLDYLRVDYHLDLMIEAGVGGLIVNWFGTRSAYDIPANLGGANVAISRAMEKGLTWTICYQDWAVIDGQWGNMPTGEELTLAQAQFRNDLIYLRDNYFSAPHFLTLEKLDGVKWAGDQRPIFLVYGPRRMTDQAFWNTEIASVFPDLATRPVVMTLFGSPKVGGGVFSWVPPMRSKTMVTDEANTKARINRYHSRLMAEKGSVSVIASSLVPGYRDFFEEGGGGGSMGRLPSFNGASFAEQVAAIQGDAPDFVQAVSWNNFQDGTSFEPSVLPEDTDEESDDRSMYLRLRRLRNVIKNVADTDDTPFEAATGRWAVKKGRRGVESCPAGSPTD
mmetsp:Transcript_45886/g.109277  ORF Transcript_45886/g.109277 Transcript_45886/m.109277 type:complete len:611 (+) Transcript_45886:74-1906(+)